MTKETTWLDKLNRAGELALTASYKASDMAGDLWRVGLEPVARRADALYEVLVEIHEQVSAATGDAVAEQINRASESSEAVLKGVLTGVLLAGGDAGPDAPRTPEDAV